MAKKNIISEQAKRVSCESKLRVANRIIKEQQLQIDELTKEVKNLRLSDVSKCACNNVNDIQPYYDMDADIFRCDKCDKHFC